MEKIYIQLGNGKVFEGKAFGAQGDCVGEIVFTTNMCGYIETLTDPSYYGQIIMQTFPLIGNYGYISNVAESNGCFAKGYIVREWCDAPSNFRAQTDVDTFLKEKGIVGVWGVDTREITKIIREYGVMNAKITTTLTDGIQDELKAYTIKDALKNVSLTIKRRSPLRCSARTAAANQRF
jgi:carbamoyl-phosphate synthase small subunit